MLPISRVRRVPNEPIALDKSFTLSFLGSVALLSGCASPDGIDRPIDVHGVYNDGGQFFGGQILQVIEDGTYVYESWSDDLSEGCKAFGTWAIRIGDQLYLVTKIDRIDSIQAGSYCETIAKTEEWAIRTTSLIRFPGEAHETRFAKESDR